MVSNFPLVSIIIPCRNEEKHIGECLDSIIKQDYLKENLEILVVDGASKDGTREIIKDYIKKYSFVTLLDNPKKFTCFAFNIGIKQAKGEIIILMGAHAAYQKDYVSKCVEYLNEYNADNVGGIWRISPREKTLIAKAITFASSSIFGAGDAYYRRGYSKGIKWVDTVFGGCYKREVFDRVGLFNEKLFRSQDFEFNKRLIKAGGKILLVPEIIGYYYPSATFLGFLRHNLNDGFWVTYPLKFGIKIFALRHLLPLFFVAGLLILLFFSLFSGIFNLLFFL